jgi:exopolyphosphatase/pppGpp-phosphohydrolase
VREGVAYSLFGSGLPSTREVREASLASLTSRFTAWEPEPAERRAAVARRLLEALAPEAQQELLEAVSHAARILDIGRSVDFFDRYEHAADIVLASELYGFDHREIALLAAVMRAARDEDPHTKPLQPLLAKPDRSAVERAGVVLALADDIEERCPGGAALTLACRLTPKQALITVPALQGWRSRALGGRFARVFGRSLLVSRGA